MAQKLKTFEINSGKFLARTNSIVILREELFTEDAYKLASSFFNISTGKKEKKMVVKNSKMPLNLAPAAFSIASLMVCIPNRNKPSPPAIDNKMELLIILPIPYIYFTLLIIKYVKTRYNIYF